MKRIAIISTTFPPLIGGGGVASAHFNLYKQLKNRGFDVKIFTFNDNDVDKNLIESDVYRFGLSKCETSKIKFLKIIKRKINKWIFNEKFDGFLKYQYDIVSDANIVIKKANKKIVEFSPEIIFLPSNGAPGYNIVKLPTARYFHICHHNPMQMIGNPLLGKHSIEDAKRAIDIEQKALSRIDVVICVSNYIKELFLQTHTFDKQVIVLPNIVDWDFINNIKKSDLHNLLGLNSEYPIIYIPSAGIKSKGEQFVIEIIRRLSRNLNNNVGFFISGVLSENQKYELSVLNHYNLKIFVSGDVTNHVNISYIKDCGLCISPSHTENYSMVLIESLILEIPCVVFNVGGNSEIVINDVTGYIVPYCDIDRMIEYSLKILMNNSLREALTQSIRDRNIESQKTSIIDKYISLF